MRGDVKVDNRLVILAHGVTALGKEPLPENGILLCYKLSGRLVYKRVATEYIAEEDEITYLELSKGYVFSDDGETAYAVFDGCVVRALADICSVGDGTSVKASECKELFLKLLDAINGDVLSEAAYRLHGVLRCIRAVVLQNASAKPDTAFLIKEYIDTHTYDKLTLDGISRVFFLSKPQIFRVFKGRYGVSPMQYHSMRKVEEAKRMLERTDMRVSDIAEELGFSDAKHMSKTFKKYSGQLPRSYRKTVRLKKAEKEDIYNIQD